MSSLSNDKFNVYLPNTKTMIAATKENKDNPTIKLKNPNGSSIMKISGPVVATSLPIPSTIPEQVERILVGKLSCVRNKTGDQPCVSSECYET